ncbi:MAG: hypothetical protein Q8N18_26395 [Opitutaceae bacterium]|nr:hypothetical protein [Opitutaceae bacterium]
MSEKIRGSSAFDAGLGWLPAVPPQLGWLPAFAALYSAGNGVTTILRGISVAEVFGRGRYAELSGALSAPGVIAKAAAPLAMAGIWTVADSPRAVFAGTFALILVGSVGLLLAIRAQRNQDTVLRALTDAVPAKAA